MTGFASLSRENDQAMVSVTLRAVNHRYLDVQVRLPAALSERESRLRAVVQQAVARGRIELAISVQPRQSPPPVVELNEAFIGALEAALAEARERGLVTGALTPGDLLRLPQALIIREQAVEEADSGIGDLVDAAVQDAVEALDSMRRHEGAHLRQDLDGRRQQMAVLITDIAAAADEGRRALQQRLAARVAEIASDLNLDGNAVVQEVVRVAGRSDITEEVTRFRAHLAHWTTLTESGDPCGRKLDFLLQEMNREINTVGSKADGTTVSELIVAAKAELERMREQVQNVE
jgi:uncharacterized protein (TIGR00255 family)